MPDHGRGVLGHWTHETVVAECRTAYNRYSRDLDRHYHDYFAVSPEERKRGLHPRQAADLARALPPGWDRLVDDLPERVRHRHHLSGRSSQTLALAVIGVALHLDFSLEGLFAALAPLPATDSPLATQFEYELPPKALNEQLPRVTSLDFYAETSSFVLCLEAKREEDGMGRCGCPPGAPAIADCSERVLQRPAYWAAATDILGLSSRQPGEPCPVSLGYQAVRSVAAARHLATGGRQAVFGLIYDAANPYFAGCGAWPGWPTVLSQSIDPRAVAFRAVSWQELIRLLPLDDDCRSWLREKHRLG
jgi:hypothetical protein